MNSFFSSQPGSSQPSAKKSLQETVAKLDRAMTRQTLELNQASQLLRQVEKFYQQAWDEMPISLNSAEFRQLLVAGCRISSDLNETVLTQLLDQAQLQDETISQLSKDLAQQLMKRAKTNQLLKKAQMLKQHTVDTAESAGLGIII